MSQHPTYRRSLEGMTVGISVSESTNSQDLGFSTPEVNRLTIRLAEMLLGEGARLVFGHGWRRDGVMTSVSSLAMRYQSSEGPTMANLLPWPDDAGMTEEEQAEASRTVEIRKVGLPRDLKDHELARQVPPDPWLRARALTFMRRQIVATVDAQICVGGRTQGAAGRFPGLVEEIYLLTVARKPIYLSGLIGGATREIIDVIRGGKPHESLFATEPEVERAFAQHAAAAGDPDGSIDRDAIRRHFTKTLNMDWICGANGLERAENDQLCDARTVDELLPMVLRGLRRVYRGDSAENPWQDEPALARRLVREGLAVLDSGTGVVKEQVGVLRVLSNEEKLGLAGFRARIEAYTKLTAPKHPLCLGVFGPPGSGKSFAVQAILQAMGHALREINLAQLEGPGDLSAALAEVARWSAGTTPVVLFDEFDAGLHGTPLGWLQWLLAPMQDGMVLYRGHPIAMKRAVFVFAGGTADTFEEFPEAHRSYFRIAKAPDFISRLRGHVNVRGVNEWPYRRVRRATILRLAIERVMPELLDQSKTIAPDRMTDDFIDQVLSVGRFVHGSRSVEALVEMATPPGSGPFTEKSLPPREVRASHVDFGPLGRIAIALSAGGGAGDYSSKLDDVWTRVASRLLELGAGLVYGGDPRAGGFTARLAEAHARLPNPLGEGSGPEVGSADAPRPGRVVWFRPDESAKSGNERRFERFDARSWPRLTENEFAELGLPPSTDLGSFDSEPQPTPGWKTSPDWCKRVGHALVMFRLRASIMGLVSAHLVFGGREFGSSGRFPGIAEEVMLSLASGKAVYVCGGFGGAARAVGRLLGLDEPWFEVPDCLRVVKHGAGAAALESAVKDWGKRFQLTHRSDLPLDYESVVEFFRSHALGSPRWPDNGLTHEENRTLFRCGAAKEITDLVTKGLRRRFGEMR